MSYDGGTELWFEGMHNNYELGLFRVAIRCRMFRREELLRMHGDISASLLSLTTDR